MLASAALAKSLMFKFFMRWARRCQASYPVLVTGLVYLACDYGISSVIRWSFFSFQNNPENLDPFYKMDLDFLGCLGRGELVL